MSGQKRKVARSMRGQSGTPTRHDPDGLLGSSSSSLTSKQNSTSPAVPVWVTHTPTPGNNTDDDSDTESSGRTSSTPPYAQREAEGKKGSAKERLKSLIPSSLVRAWTRERDGGDESDASTGRIQILPNGTRVSPPVSPLMERRNWDGSLGSSKPLLRETPTDDMLRQSPQMDSLITSIHPAEYYAEKLEVYNQKYSYLKSWPGLLRLLAGLELLFGGMVFACVIAYIQKDSEWSNSYGLYNGIYNNGMGLSGYSYSGPMTPFILSVAGVTWILTFFLLVLGMTMYYRTILLDAPWWPLTEALINVALFLLYMAAGIVYLNDLNRGGLCYMTVGVNPIMANLCRVDGGQMAGTAFIFINMIMYLGSFLVCLKMWRHEATRREREYFRDSVMPSEEGRRTVPPAPQRLKRISFKDEMDGPRKDRINQQEFISGTQKNPTTVPAYNPEIHVVPDYIVKYPEIDCVEEREKYKAVFNDQYQEYKDLHKDISTTLSKFSELDAMMSQLLKDGKGQEEQHRIQNLMKTYQQKKSDPAFLEKRERCDYLKAKLSHIKHRIRTFDEEMLRQK